MKTDMLSQLPDWPALMDLETTILYLGGSLTDLEELESCGYLRRWRNGHQSVRFIRSEVDAALNALAAHEREVAQRAAEPNFSDQP